MKVLIILVAVGLLAAAEDLYDSNNDNVNIEEIVGDNNKLEAFMGCFLDTLPCDEVSGDFKKDLPEAVAQACAKCTPAQKHILKRFLDVSKEKIPEKFEALKSKLDPEDKYYTILLNAISTA